MSHAIVIPTHPLARLLVAVAVAFAACAFAGCGGGGSKAAAAPVIPPLTVTVSGTATYTFVPITAGGLNYAGSTTKPIRGAVIELRNAAATTVYATSTTDAFGAYTLAAPPSTAVTIVVKAALGSTTVVDNTNGNAVYAVAFAHVTGAGNSTGVAFNAATTFASGAYTNRSGGPFAILDTIHSGQQLILSADPAIVFPPLQVMWSVNNTAATIGTSFYDGAGHIFVLGGEDLDTDEYDAGVIAHEWGHYIEGNFSRSDSLGGQHGGGNILDETVAFGEGFGNAFSGMVRNDPVYLDTFSTHQASIAVLLNVESDSVGDTTPVSGTDARLRDGAWSEASVQEILWDVYDSPGNGDSDGDAVTLGFPAIWNVLVGPQKTTAGFTTIYSFLTHLKAQNPTAATAINNLAAAEDITTFDQFQETGAGRQRYTVVANTGTPKTVDVNGVALQTYATYGAMSVSDAGNKYLNRQMFMSTAPAGGTCRIRVTPNSPGDFDILLPGGAGAFGSSTVNETYTFSATAGQPIYFSVQSYTSGGAGFSVQVGTPTTVPKPAPLAPSMPIGNG